MSNCLNVKERLKAHIMEFKICYLSEIKDINSVKDEFFKTKREIVYAHTKETAELKLKLLYDKCAIIDDLKLIKVSNIK